MPDIKFRVLDGETAQPVTHAAVSVVGTKGDVLLTSKPDREGHCSLVGVQRGAAVEVRAEGYLSKHYLGSHPPAHVRLLKDVVAVFVDRPSAVPGDEITVYLNAPAGCAVRLRCGHGPDRDTGVVDVGNQDAARAELPDEDVVAEGVSWPSFSFQVPDVRSGLWILEVSSADEIARAPLIIRRSEDAPRARVLVLASVATWMCYNHWGGRNRYRNNENGPSSGAERRARGLLRRLIALCLKRIFSEVSRTRIKKVLGVERTASSWISKRISWSRPWGAYCGLSEDPSAVTLNHLASLDLKILAWLDEHDVDYECAADVDLHFSPTLCDDRDAVVLLGHSEYWSTSMFDQLRNAHTEKGVWVLNLSGNSMYRTIEIFPDYSIKLSHLVMRMSGRDETELTGVRFSEAGYGTAAPYEVLRPDHWAFEELRLEGGDLFGQRCLIDNVTEVTHAYNPAHPATSTSLLNGIGAAGFEVDRLARSRRGEFELIARGVARGSAHMVVKDPDGRCGGSFSASSINFGGSLLVDDVCSKVVLNVLERATNS